MLADFNLKEQFKVWKRAGKPIPKEYFDLGIAYWLISPDEKEYTPEYISRTFLKKEWKNSEKEIKALQVFAEKKLKEYKLEKLFWDLEMPLVDILANIESTGIQLDKNYLRSYDKELEKKLGQLTKSIYKIAGETFNINSPKQLGMVLFQKLKIDEKGVKKTRAGSISTDINTLETIRERHPIVRHVLEYRELFKWQSTYVRPLQEAADPKNRVHTHYIQTGAATGRLSSQDPNLQNIPIGTEWATKLRNAFVAEKGYQLAAFDYSQIELRVLASLSEDPKMVAAFKKGLDIHKLTAANVNNVPLEKVTPEMRRLAKTLNFGVVYGMGAFAFAKTSGLKVAEARKFIEEYFNDFQKIKIWQEMVKAQARTYGYVTNANGRRRFMLAAVSRNSWEAAEAERAAINMPVQGLAADIIKMAMIAIAKELKQCGWWQKEVRMLLTIHDELLFEIKESIIKEAAPIIRRLMESAYRLKVPVRVSEKIGSDWGSLKEIHV